MSRKRLPLRIMGDDEVARAARILGPASAAAEAMAERARRAEAGEAAVFIHDPNVGVILVGPDPRIRT